MHVEPHKNATMKLFSLFCILFVLAIAVDAQTTSLKPGMMVRVRLGPSSDFKQIHTVDAQGALNLPILGKVTVEGLTSEQATALLTQRYADIQHTNVENARISVTILEPVVKVLGKVQMPIVLQYASDLTVLTALAKAGGLLNPASHNEVFIVRSSTRIKVDIKELERHPEEDVILSPGDTLEVN